MSVKNIKFYKRGLKFAVLEFNDNSTLILNKQELMDKTHLDNSSLKSIIEDMEYYVVKTFNNLVFILIIGSSEQYGIMIGIDTEKNNIIHISNAAYVSDFDFDDNYLYMLYDVHNFAIRPYYAYSKIAINHIDYDSEPNSIKLDCEITASSSKDTIHIKNNILTIQIGDMNFTIKVDK